MIFTRAIREGEWGWGWGGNKWLLGFSHVWFLSPGAASSTPVHSHRKSDSSECDAPCRVNQTCWLDSLQQRKQNVAGGDRQDQELRGSRERNFSGKEWRMLSTLLVMKSMWTCWMRRDSKRIRAHQSFSLIFKKKKVQQKHGRGYKQQVEAGYNSIKYYTTNFQVVCTAD